MSKVFKAVKKILPTALPIAASFIPGIGPLGLAAAGAAGGALGGGGLKGALLGGALGALGGGTLGSAPGTSGIGFIDSLNNSLFQGMSPLRSLASSAMGGVSDFIGAPLKALGLGGGGGTSMTAPIQGMGEIAMRDLGPLTAESIMAGASPAAESPGFFSKILNSLKDPSMSDIAGGVALLSALNPQQPEGTLSQQDILNQMNRDKEKQELSNAKFIAGLNSAPLQRARISPTIDYYSYGSRPEAVHFDNVGGAPAQFRKGGKVKSPLGAMGGQDDTIDAKLSEGEYVLSADVVSGLGDGNTSAGAKKLDNLQKNVRKHKATSNKKGKLPPKAKSPLAYLGATA